MDGFTYNIFQMSGEQAFRMQLRIVNIVSGFKIDSLGDTSEKDTLFILIKGIFSAANPDVIIPIVKELFVNVTLIDVNKAVAEQAGYNADRHPIKKVALDHFYGKDLAHLYRLVYEILKANYEDFLIQAKEWLGSGLGKKIAESLGNQ